jgi:hypothetical protein
VAIYSQKAILKIKSAKINIFFWLRFSLAIFRPKLNITSQIFYAWFKYVARRKEVCLTNFTFIKFGAKSGSIFLYTSLPLWLLITKLTQKTVLQMDASVYPDRVISTRIPAP